VAQKLL